MNLESVIQNEVRKRKTDTIHECKYMEFRKMVPMILHEGQQKRHRHIEQIFVLIGRRREWDDVRE